MNAIHWHLVLNHFPVVLFMLSTVLYLVVCLRKLDTLRVFALLLIVIGGVLTVPVHMTGERSEEDFERRLLPTSATIGPHEEAAEKTLILAGISSAIAILGLLFLKMKKAIPVWLSVLLMLALTTTSVLFAWTGNLGGKIGHPEIIELPNKPH